MNEFWDERNETLIFFPFQFTTNPKKKKTPTYIKKKQQRKREKKQIYLLAIEIPNHNKILKLLQLLKKLQPAFL